jgi:hypothetical protein
LFDQLFRRHLENVYRVLGEAPPTSLARPISGHKPRVRYTQPRGFLDVRIDGRQSSYFEWSGAGTYTAGSERGSMTLVSDGVIREIRFGFNERTLFIRVDTAGAADRDLAATGVDGEGGGSSELRVRFVEPRDTDLVVRQAGPGAFECVLLRQEKALAGASPVAAVGRVLEAAVAFEALGTRPGELLGFFVELFAEGRSLDRAPAEGMLELEVPGPEFQARAWQA